MKITNTNIPDVKIIEPKVFEDDRGWFYEVFNKKKLEKSLNRDIEFVQENLSKSEGEVIRGLHYQIKYTQAKLVRAVVGSIFDVAVDIRRDSPTFGKHVTVELTSANHKMLWIPEGFAHGFLTMTKYTKVAYLATEYYAPNYDRVIRWDDPDINIGWPYIDPIVSNRDMKGLQLRKAELF